MNANELAKLLEVDSWYKLVSREEITTMLRQQQAEIDHLKRCIHDAISWLDIKGKSKDAEIIIEILNAKEYK